MASTRLLKRQKARLLDLGYGPRPDKIRRKDPALRATVKDLAFHCTDMEIALFCHTRPGAVIHQRKALHFRKYISDIYIRPAA